MLKIVKDNIKKQITLKQKLGSKYNPYIIKSIEDIEKLRKIDSKNKYFKQVNNINLNNENFIPIKNFNGYYDGNNCKIIGLKIKGNFKSENVGFIIREVKKN